MCGTSLNCGLFMKENYKNGLDFNYKMENNRTQWTSVIQWKRIELSISIIKSTEYNRQ